MDVNRRNIFVNLGIASLRHQLTVTMTITLEFSHSQNSFPPGLKPLLSTWKPYGLVGAITSLRVCEARKTLAIYEKQSPAKQQNLLDKITSIELEIASVASLLRNDTTNM